MPNKEAKNRKRLKRKLALENQTRKREAYKARQEARRAADRDV